MERWREVGRWLGSVARTTRAASPRPGRPATPVELRVYLPLLWPEGPDGPVDQAALRALGRDYARAGRVMDELLTDLDILCSVVGIGASSSMVEASSVAWSDAFLDVVAAGTMPAPSLGAVPRSAEEPAVDQVAQRLAAFGGTVWGDLAPSGCLLLVTCPSGSADDRLVDELDRVVEEVHRLFPGAVVASQPSRRRVAAAVTNSAETDAMVSALRLRCAELVRSTPPEVTVARVVAGDDTAQRLLRSVG